MALFRRKVSLDTAIGAAGVADRAPWLEAWIDKGDEALSAWRRLGIACVALFGGIFVVWNLVAPPPADVAPPVSTAALRTAPVLVFPSGVRMPLVERRAKELDALLVTDPDRAGRLLAYAEILKDGQTLVEGQGLGTPSDALLAAVADALQAGGATADVVRLLQEAPGDTDGRVRALDRFLIGLRRGLSSSAAVAAALSNGV